MARSEADKAARAAASARYRKRKSITAMALMAGWDETDIVAVFTKPNGVHVAIDSNGKRVRLIADPDFDTETARIQAEPVTPEQLADEPVKKLYPPKLWTQEQWTQFVAQAKKSDRDKVLVFLHSKVEGEGTQAEHKLWKQGLAIVEAIPDSPDWADYLPLYEEA